MQINIVAHAAISDSRSQVPRTTHNFVTLCQRKYYNGVKLHRLIQGFMVTIATSFCLAAILARDFAVAGRWLMPCYLQVQGGDPTGTGTGGESAWGRPFKDVRSAFSLLDLLPCDRCLDCGVRSCRSLLPRCGMTRAV
jgi:hypothetical protein